MPVAGVDVGSVAAKAVIFDPQSRSLLGKAVLPTGWNAREAGEKALAAACADAGGIAASRIVGTGYGRISLPFADKVVTEITCHARGAAHLFPGTGVVLDIGGQDSKVISTAPDGSVQDFLMNDKCAAGTGRFLQVLSGILGMEPEVAGAMDRLRTFMFQHVYTNPVAKGEESKAKDIIRRLFEYYSKHPDKLPADFIPQLDFDGMERIVCDYIAGMTDKYAIYKYSEIFIPTAWQVR